MVAQHSTDGEDAAAALLAGTGGPADRGNRARAGVDRSGDLTVTDHGAVAEDHEELQIASEGKACLSLTRLPGTRQTGFTRPG
jgi:hypothetical protein